MFNAEVYLVPFYDPLGAEMRYPLEISIAFNGIYEKFFGTNVFMDKRMEVLLWELLNEWMETYTLVPFRFRYHRRVIFSNISLTFFVLEKPFDPWHTSIYETQF